MSLAVLHKKDLIQAQFYISSDQTILGLLKDEGAPILGSILLRPDPTYEWKRREYRDTEAIQYEWYKITEE